MDSSLFIPQLETVGSESATKVSPYTQSRNTNISLTPANKKQSSKDNEVISVYRTKKTFTT